MATRDISVSDVRTDFQPTNQKSATRKNSDITNFARMILGQGTLLGFGDELEAGIRNIFDERGYGEILDEVQGELKQFRRDRPVASTVAELGGSLLTGGAGVGRTVAKTALKSGALGGLYGAGSTDDTGSDSFGDAAVKRIQNSVNSAIFSAGLGGAGKKFFGVSKDAQKLLDKGVKLTPGQTIDGFVGTGLKKIEEAATSIPVLGTAGMFDKVKKTFNIAVANEIGKDIGVVVPKNTPLNDVSKVLTQQIKKALDSTSEKLKINKPDELLDEIVVNLQNSKVGQNIINREIKNFNDFFMRQLSFNADDTLTGSNVQKLDEYITKMSREFTDAENYDLRIISDVFTNASNKLKNTLIKDSGKDAFSDYKAVKNAYKNLQIFNNASIKSTAKSGFEPSQLLRSSIQADPTKGKVGTILGKGQLQDIAETGQSVIGKTVPDSGTFTRSLVGGGLLGGGAYFDPVTAGLGSLGLLAYKVPAIRNQLIGGRGIIKSSPFIGSGLGERFGLQ